MKRIDIETVQRMQKERRAINDLSVQDIEVYENGEVLKISQEARDAFEFSGLPTIDFISSGWFRTLPA